VVTATDGEGISFGLQAAPDAGQWPAFASRAESLGFETLCTADHPGLTVSPFAALAAAAPSTKTIRLGTAVVNAGVRDPFDIASDVATLDLLSDGRALLGLGAGSTPSEWTSRGREYPSPGERIEHLSRVTSIPPRSPPGSTTTATNQERGDPRQVDSGMTSSQPTPPNPRQPRAVQSADESRTQELCHLGGIDSSVHDKARGRPRTHRTYGAKKGKPADHGRPLR
jgi:alkanesulfonate monooxygenase SsuD/methylene tetrahydromethanopterin reductase-like flavin-dependent oxidoreductase (luciferase family)